MTTPAPRLPRLTLLSAPAAILAMIALLVASGVAASDSGSVGGLAATANQLWHQDSPGLEGEIEGSDEFGKAVAIGDFNNDGEADLAIGIGDDVVPGSGAAGAVSVLYGTPTGLDAAGDQLWHQDSPGLMGSAEEGDQFGQTLAVGNFNGDDYADLAIGVPGEGVGAPEAVNAGSVNVLYGSPTGLDAAGNQIWHQDIAGVPDTAADFENFGAAITAGDFDGDGEDDLAIGVPGQTVSMSEDAGGIHILYGSPTGLTTDGTQIFSQEGDVPGALEEDDAFGSSLAAGDFNGDSNDDLAVGSPGEAVGALARAGAAIVLYGSGAGLSAAGAQIWHQDVTDIQGSSEENDAFGDALAAGDFDGNGDDDLAIGVPGESISPMAGAPGAAGAVDAAGIVQVLYGTPSGLDADGNEIWSQDSTGILDVAHENDRFGATLASGDFNDDNDDDLAVGITGEDSDGLNGAGAVQVIFGSGTGLTSDGNQFWQQGVNGILGTPDGGADFGDALATGDLNGLGDDDLAIGVPDNDIDGQVNAGAVNVIYSDAPAPTPTPTDTATPTDTPPGPTSTPTNTPPGPTNTPTDTPVGPTNTPTNTPPAGGLIGDVNCDGMVNAIDASLILQLAAGLLDELPCPENADTNEDGNVNAIDASLILQLSAGLLDQLPP